MSSNGIYFPDLSSQLRSRGFAPRKFVGPWSGPQPPDGPGQVDRPQRRRTAALRSAEEHHDAAVGRPGRTLVLPARGQQSLTAAVGLHHADAELAAASLAASWRRAASATDQASD